MISNLLTILILLSVLFYSQMPITQCFILFPDAYYSVFYFIPRCLLLRVSFYSQMPITQCFSLFSDAYYSVFYFIPRCLLLSVLFYFQMSITCANCGVTEARYFTKQLRSADEGQTIFYKCLTCG